MFGQLIFIKIKSTSQNFEEVKKIKFKNKVD